MPHVDLPRGNRLLRMVVHLDAVASGALVVVVLAAVLVLALWATPTLVLVVGLLLIGYMVALAAMGAVIACLLVSATARGPSPPGGEAVGQSS